MCAAGLTPTGAAAVPGADGQGSPRRFVGGRGREGRGGSAAKPRERPGPGAAVSCWPRGGVPQADIDSFLESLPGSRAQPILPLPPSNAEGPLRLSPWQLHVPPAPPVQWRKLRVVSKLEMLQAWHGSWETLYLAFGTQKSSSVVHPDKRSLFYLLSFCGHGTLPTISCGLFSC